MSSPLFDDDAVRNLPPTSKATLRTFMRSMLAAMEDEHITAINGFTDESEKTELISGCQHVLDVLAGVESEAGE